MIDPNIQSQLRQRFNPDGSQLRTLQLRLLDILKYIDSICRKNNIHYWISSGTALGAVRHGGFIPWDDDADIEMTRSDYKRFRKAVMADNNPRFIIHDHHSDPEYVARFAKIADLKPLENDSPHTDDYVKYLKYRGPFVDIFLISPSNSRKLAKFCGHLQGIFLFRLNYISNPSLRLFLKKTSHFIMDNAVFPAMRLMLRPFAGKRLRHTAGVEYLAPRNSDDLRDVIYVKFENIQLPIPIGYDNYLRRMFGNYMQLPYFDKIQTHVIDLDKNQKS